MDYLRTDAQYDLLIACFKNGFSNKAIRFITGIPLNRIYRERNRWAMCQMIGELDFPKTYVIHWNGGKRLGVKPSRRPIGGWQ